MSDAETPVNLDEARQERRFRETLAKLRQAAKADGIEGDSFLGGGNSMSRRPCGLVSQNSVC